LEETRAHCIVAVAINLLRLFVCPSIPASLPPFLPLLKNQNQRDQTLLGLLKTILRKHSLLPKILQMQLHPITIRITITGRIKHKNTTHPKKKKKYTPTQGATLKTRNFLSPIQTHKQSTIVECTLYFPPFFFLFLLGKGGNLPMGSMLLNFKTQILETLRNFASCNKQTPQCNNKSSLLQT
jgi:hypothetical protein